MINWLKEWFNPTTDNLHTHSGINISDNVVFLKDPLPDISEPVYAIEKSIVNHPSHWKLEYKDPHVRGLAIEQTWVITDIKNKIQYSGKFIFNPFSKEQEIIHVEKSDCLWITDDELSYLTKAIRNMQEGKSARYDKIYQARMDKERQRLMEIYNV